MQNSKSQLPVEPLAVTIANACRMSGLGRTTIYKLSKEGRLKIRRVAGRSLVEVAELRRLIAEAA